MSWRIQQGHNPHPRWWPAPRDRLWGSAIPGKTTVTGSSLADRVARSMKCNISMRSIFCLTWKARLIELCSIRIWIFTTPAPIPLGTCQTKAEQAHPVGVGHKACRQEIRTCRSTTTFCIANVFTMRFTRTRTLTKTWVITIMAPLEARAHTIPWVFCPMYLRPLQSRVSP